MYTLGKGFTAIDRACRTYASTDTHIKAIEGPHSRYLQPKNEI